jgi:hypothetical protein
MRHAIDLDAPERASVHCSCSAMLGEWDGMHRLVFEPEDLALPPILGQLN